MVAHAPGLCRWRQDRSTRSEVKFSLAIRNIVSKKQTTTIPEAEEAER